LKIQASINIFHILTLNYLLKLGLRYDSIGDETSESEEEEDEEETSNDDDESEEEEEESS